MKTNKWIIALGIVACAGTVQAQTMYDITPLMTPELNGTARFVGMGGAMSALGADLSVMGTNPAGIGLYRSSDVAVTASTNNVVTKSNMYGTASSDNKSKLSFDQVGFVYSTKVGNTTALRYLNFGFNYHKYNNFNKKSLVNGSLNSVSSNGASQTAYMATQLNNAMNYVGASTDDFEKIVNSSGAYDNTDIGWLGLMGRRMGLVEPNGNGYVGYASDYMHSGSNTSGGVNQCDFNISFNVKDQYYFGVTLGVYDIDYSRYSWYGEEGLGSGVGDSYYVDSWNKIEGSGVDVKLGAIIRPIESSPWRVGLAIHTPTWYNLKERTYSELSIDDQIVERSNDGWDNETKCELRTPWRFNLSTGYTVGSTLALDAEYEYADYSTAKLSSDRDHYSYYDDYWYSEDDTYFRYRNLEIKNSLKGVHSLKLGMEAKLAPMLSLRLGYNYASSMYEKDAYKDLYSGFFSNSANTETQFANERGSNTATVGLGFKAGKFYVDMAYLYRQTKYDFYAFDFEGMKATDLKDNYHRVLLTAGFRF